MDKNRFVCEKLGLCWHDFQYEDGGYTEGFWFCKCGIKTSDPMNYPNPDFRTDSGAVELLRLMENHKDGKLLFAKLLYRGSNVEGIDDDGLIQREYITTPGALLDAVAEWFGWEDKNDRPYRGA